MAGSYADECPIMHVLLSDGAFYEGFALYLSIPFCYSLDLGFYLVISQSCSSIGIMDEKSFAQDFCKQPRVILFC